MHRTLDMLCPGVSAQVRELYPQGDPNRLKRLWDLGFTGGAQVKCLFRAPSGEPVAYQIRGTVVALRKEEAALVRLTDGGDRPENPLSADCLHKGVRPGDTVVALAGNPNVGKSTVFNHLTGMRQHTGNWPGKTVTGAWGRCEQDGRGYVFVDTPGTYSLEAQSAEEIVARDCICFGGADAVAVVCDATSLERNLNLALQILECTRRVVIVVNLIDEAEKQHIRVDLKALEAELGVPVVGCAARSGRGLAALIPRIREAIDGEPTANVMRYAPEIEAALEPVAAEIGEGKLPVSARFAALRMLEGGPFSEEIADRLELSGQARARIAQERQSLPDAREHIVSQIYRRAEKIVHRCVCAPNLIRRRQARWDWILTGRATGIPILLMLLAAVFFLTIKGANLPSELLSDAFGWLEAGLAGLLGALRAPVWLEKLLTEGVFRVLGWVVAVMLPPMAIFFPLFTILEDLGVLPRVAFNLDRQFKRCHACGKQCLTMLMGLGCNAVGVTGCRIIDSPRERLIAILTNVFMPCNGRFPMMIALIAAFLAGGSAGSAAASALILTLVIVLGVAVTFLVSRVLSGTLLKGVPSSFTLELPPFRRPQFVHVLIRSLLDRTLFVLGRAVKVAAPAGLVIWLMANLSISGQTVLQICVGFLDPFARVLGLDGAILMAFILGFPANEIVLPLTVMAYQAGGALVETQSLAALRGILVQNGWTWLTALNAILFSLMHWPCSTTLITVHKETGSCKWTLAALWIPTLLGMAACALTTLLARILGLV